MVRKLEDLRRGALFEIATLAEPYIPASLFGTTAGEKKDIYTRQRTFWTFLWQTLHPDASCRAAVRKLLSLWHGERGRATRRRRPSPATGAYCIARKRLDAGFLRGIVSSMGDTLQRRCADEDLWCGRRVRVVDGTGLSMPNTPENQAAFPQNAQQKPGCGFPVVKLVGCFCLHTGAWLYWACGTLREHEARLWKSLWKYLEAGDIVLADRGFSSYGSLAGLAAQGVDGVLRLHQCRRADLRRGKRLGAHDRLHTWKRPQRPKNSAWQRDEWSSLPEQIAVRVLRFRVEIAGFRTREVALCTSLADPVAYPFERLAELYLRRWSVELSFRDLKTTLGMDILRCRTPDMIEKEILMHAITYNLVRALMYESRLESGVPLERFSFKGALDTLITWHTQCRLDTGALRRRELSRAILELLARDTLPHRPWRSEPRAVKRRPKTYQLLTKPRHLMVVSPSRKLK